MRYQVTARKWRPQAFDALIGQEPIAQSLQNAVASGNFAHAVLLSGPRGVGKTSTARLYAKALNCEQSPHICNTCAACLEIGSGNSVDVREIDGASNRGIEHMRDIRDGAALMPLQLRYKVFVIDEVHMLTKEASSALLKTLEEPPEHVVFVLATTEPQKVLATIRSRCQHYLFRRISVENIVAHLSRISDEEGVRVDSEALYAIARAGDGSMRDSQSIFDQLRLYSQGEEITLSLVRSMLGTPKLDTFHQLVEALEQDDAFQILQTLHDYMDEHGNPRIFVTDFVFYLRGLLLASKLPVGHSMLAMSPSEYEFTQQLIQRIGVNLVQQWITLFAEVYPQFTGNSDERFLLEATFFRAMDAKRQLSLPDLASVLKSFLMTNGMSAENHAASALDPRADTPKSPQPPVNQDPIQVLGTILASRASYRKQQILKIERKQTCLYLYVEQRETQIYLEEARSKLSAQLSQQMGTEYTIQVLTVESTAPSLDTQVMPSEAPISQDAPVHPPEEAKVPLEPAATEEKSPQASKEQPIQDTFQALFAKEDKNVYK